MFEFLISFRNSNKFISIKNITSNNELLDQVKNDGSSQKPMAVVDERVYIIINLKSIEFLYLIVKP